MQAAVQPQFQIKNTTLKDLPFIYELFDLSVKYQEARGFPTWKNYDKGALTQDIQNKEQYKVVLDTQIGIVFSVRYADKVIWREMDQSDAIYLHRIVVNPAFKGQKLFGEILSWATNHAKQKKLGFVRMDTWATNEKIIEYYKSFGFKFIGNYTTPDTPELPQHNRNLALALLELKL